MRDACFDPPAAHSMDTLWFAVDDDGNVAAMDSNEPGAVPVELADESFDAHEVLHEIIEQHAPRIWAHGAVRGVHCGAGHDDSFIWLLLFIKKGYDLPERVHRIPRTIVHAPLAAQDDHVVPVTTGIGPTDYRTIHDDGACLGCLSGRPRRLGGLGVFHYTCDDYATGPYERCDVPARPLKLEEMPDAWRNLLRPSHLPGAHFANALRVQPIEHVKCRATHDYTYVGTDGVTHEAPLDLRRPAPPDFSRPTPARVISPASTRRWWEFWK